MKRIFITMCILAAILSGCVPVYAAAEEQSSYYPISVEEYTTGSLDEHRIEKAYQLSPSLTTE